MATSLILVSSTGLRQKECLDEKMLVYTIVLSKPSLVMKK